MPPPRQPQSNPHLSRFLTFSLARTTFPFLLLLGSQGRLFANQTSRVNIIALQLYEWGVIVAIVSVVVITVVVVSVVVILVIVLVIVIVMTL